MKAKIGESRYVNINTNPNWLTLLGCILVLLKLMGLTQVATLSWWLVLLPFYAGILVFFGIISIAIVVMAIVFLIAWIADMFFAK